MSRPIVPRGDRVLAKRVAAASQIGSVIIPEAARGKTQMADVLYQGDGETVADLTPGTRVVIANYGGTSIVVDDEELLVLRDSDIIATVPADG